MNKYTLMIVEDDGILAIHLQDLLTRQGYIVHKPVATGEQAIKEVKKHKPDLVLMDIELGGEMNGITSAEIIGNEYDVPVIFLTGYSQDPMLQQAKIAAPYGYLVKPVPERELAASIEMALYKHRVDHQIKVSEAKYRSLVEQATDGIILYDDSGKFLEANQTYCQMLGFSHDDILNMRYQDVIDADNLKEDPLRFGLMKVGKTIRLERILVRSDGSRLPVEISGRMLVDGNFQGIVRDITERVEIEHQSAINEQRMRLLLEIAEYKAKDTQDLLDYALEKAISLTESKIGYIYFYNEDTREFILKRECAVTEPQSLYCLDKTGIWGEAVRQRKAIIINDYEAPDPQKKGYPEGHVHLKKFLTIPVFVNQKIVAVVGVANKPTNYDSTDELQLTLMMDFVWKMVEQSQVEDKMRLEVAALNAAANAIVITDREGIITWANPAFTRLTGFSMGEAYGKNPRELVKSGAHDVDFYKKMWDTINSGLVWQGELLNKRKDGCLYHEEMTITPLPDSAGEIKQFIAIKQDITERKKAEEESRRNEVFLKTIFNAIPTPVFYNDNQGRYRRVNRALTDMMQVPENDLLGKTIVEINPSEEAKASLERDMEVLRTGGDQLYETEVLDRQGNAHPVIYHKAAHINPDGIAEGFVSVLMDISEQKRTEEQLRRQSVGMEKLLSISQDFLKLSSADVNFQQITDDVLRVSGGAYAVFNRFENNGLDFRTIAVAGVGEQIKKINRLLGFNLAGKTWAHDPVRFEKIKDNTITRFESLLELAGNVIPLPVIEALTKTFKPGEMVIARIHAGDTNIGDFTIIMPKGVHFEVDDLLSIYARQVGLLLQRKQAEDEMRRSETFINSLFNAIPTPVYYKDTQGRFVRINQEMSRILGLPEEQILGKTVFDHNPQDKAQEYHKKDLELLSSGEPQRYESVVFDPDGKPHVMIFHKAIHKSQNGKPEGYIGVLMDISERKQMEETLAFEKQRLANIIKATDVGTWEWNIQTGENVFNERYMGMLGYTLEELPATSKTWESLIHPEDRVISDRQLDMHLKGELDYYDCEVRLCHKDGRWIWVQVRGKVTRWTDDGKPLMMYGTHQDITERWQAEEIRRQLEDKFTKAFNTSPDAITITSLEDGCYLDVNDGFCRFSGYSREETIGKTSNELNLWADPEERMAIVRGLTRDGLVENLEFSFRIKGGEIVTGLVSASIIEIEGKTCILAVTRDISVRKHMEEALRYSEERFRLLFDQMAEGFALHEIIVDENQKPVDYRFIEINPAFEKQTGLKREETVGRTVREVLPQSEEYWIETYGKVALQGESLRYENFHSELNRWYSVGAFSPKFGQFAVTVEDITASKQTLLALEESTERFRQVTESINEVFWLCDAATGNILYVSPNFETVFGRTCDSFYKNPQSFLDYVHQDDVEDIRRGQIALREQGIYSDQEYRIIRPDGEVRWLHGKVFPVKDAEGRTIRYTGTDEDITERHQLDEALRNRERLLNQIFDILPVGLWIANEKGELVRSNAAGRKIWGAEPLVEQGEYGMFKVRRLPSREELAAEDWALAKTINEGVTIQNEMLEIDAIDGVKRIILNSTAPVCDDDGRVHSAVNVNLDITEWMQTEEALKSTQLQFKSLIENAPDGIALLNEARQFIYVSPAGRKIFGYDVDDSLDAAPDSLTHPDDLPIVLSELQKIFVNPRLIITLQYRFKHKNGSYRWLESIFTNLLHEPSVNGIVINFRDITARRAAEQKVQEQINELRRWNAVTLGRENRVLELKQEVNRLCKQADLPPVYGSVDAAQEQYHD